MSKTSLAVVDQTELFAGLEEIPADTKAALEREDRALREDVDRYGKSKLGIGEHLSKIQQLLKEDRAFLRFVRNQSLFSQRSAYRYIAGYESAKTLPASVLSEVMATGMNMLGDEKRPFGVYTEAIKALPPPKTTDAVKVRDYLEKVKELRSTLRAEKAESEKPEELLREAFRAVNSRFQRLPKNHKTKQRFVERLVGMIMTDLGVSSPQRYEPIAIPAGYKVVRGRPRKDREDAA